MTSRLPNLRLLAGVLLALVCAPELPAATGDVVIDTLSASGRRVANNLTPSANMVIGFDAGGNLVVKAGGSASTAWADITGKPSTFPPSAHNQAWSTITDTPTTLAGYGITNAQPLATVLTNTTASFTTALETKLNGIAAGAEVNVNPDWLATSGDARILNKPTTLAGYGITDANPLPASPTSGDYFGLRHLRGTGTSWVPLTGTDPNDFLTYQQVLSATRTGIILPAWDDESPGVTTLRSADHDELVDVRLPAVSGTLALLSDIPASIADGATLENGLTFPYGGFSMQDEDDPHVTFLEITGSNTANKALLFDINDAPRNVSLSGNLTVSSAATVSGTNTGDMPPAGTGSELQFRSSGSAFGAVTGSSVSGGVLTLRDRLIVQRTGNADAGAGLEVLPDPANGSVRALFILPPSNSTRIYFGKSGQAPFALNLSNVSQIENMPGVVWLNGIAVGLVTNTFIMRSGGGGTAIGANHPGDRGLEIFHTNTFDSATAAHLAGRVHRTGGLSWYRTSTSDTSFERASLRADGTDFLLTTEKGSGGGSDRALKLGAAGGSSLTIDALGRIIPVLPTSAAGLPTGALWNDAGTVKVAP